MSIRAFAFSSAAALVGGCSSLNAAEPGATAATEPAQVILFATKPVQIFSGDASLGGEAMQIPAPVEVYSFAVASGGANTAEPPIANQLCLSNDYRRSVLVMLDDAVEAEVFQGEYVSVSSAPGPLDMQLRERTWCGREPLRADDWTLGPRNLVLAPGEIYYLNVTTQELVDEAVAQVVLEHYRRSSGRS